MDFFSINRNLPCDSSGFLSARASQVRSFEKTCLFQTSTPYHRLPLLKKISMNNPEQSSNQSTNVIKQEKLFMCYQLWKGTANSLARFRVGSSTICTVFNMSCESLGSPEQGWIADWQFMESRTGKASQRAKRWCLCLTPQTSFFMSSFPVPGMSGSSGLMGFILALLLHCVHLFKFTLPKNIPILAPSERKTTSTGRWGCLESFLAQWAAARRPQPFFGPICLVALGSFKPQAIKNTDIVTGQQKKTAQGKHGSLIEEPKEL